MSPPRTVTWVFVGLAGIHGYIFFWTGEVYPCGAASKLMKEEYQISSKGLGMEIQHTDCSGSGYVSADEVLAKIFPSEVVGKIKTAGRWGILGCFVPAVLGWRAVLPITNSK